MNWRKKKWLKLIGILLIIGLSAFLFQFYGIKQGLDLAGGARVTLKAHDTDQRKVDEEAIAGIINVMERRINGLGLAEANIRPVQNTNRIVVELPGVENPMEVIDVIGRTAMLKFKSESGETLLTGDYLVNAQPDKDQYGRDVVSIEMNSEGAKLFRQITKERIGQRIGIYLDDELLTNPQVNEVIPGGKAQISGYASFEAAAEDALLLREGALPVKVTYEEIRNIDATLGEISITQSLKAGILGLILVCIFMMFWYRYPGFIATQALIIYGIIVLGVLSGFRATLTLPGIAGLILSIGMAVDANIIIFERIKEELRMGKSVSASIKSGFKRAVRTILDSNITTLITALILAYFTSGTVRGFAVTLGIGIVASMFTAIFVTRSLMDLQRKFIKSPEAFRVRR